jgi:hypothetical protein
VEWELPEGEAPYATFLDVEYAFDELYEPSDVGVTPQTYNKSTVAEWYIRKTEWEQQIDFGSGYGDADWTNPAAHPYGRFGPWGSDRWYGKAAGDGPNELAGSSQHLGSTTGGTQGWKKLDSSYWAHANTNWLPYGGYDEGQVDLVNQFPKFRPANPAQATFIVMPRAMLTDTPPWSPRLAWDQGEPDYLNGQSIALRVLVQPRRYRVHYQPKIPDITYSGGPEINMNPDGAGQVLY